MRLGLQSNEGDTVISTLFVRCTVRPGYCCCHSVKQLAVSACVGGKREKGVRKESISLDCCKHGWYQTLAVGMVWEVGGATPYWIRIWFSLRPTGTVKWLLSSLYLFDVVACLCTCLNEHCIQFLSFLLPLLCGRPAVCPACECCSQPAWWRHHCPTLCAHIQSTYSPVGMSLHLHTCVQCV